MRPVNELGPVINAHKRYANQVCNTFANGDSSRSSRRDDAWKNPGTGTTVSPDNLLLWDGPDRGGLWGYVEPLIYREARQQTYRISRWRPFTQLGSVRGVVTFEGRPMPGTRVTLTSRLTTITGADGRFQIFEVPYGDYRIEASHTGTETNLTAERRVGVDRPVVDADFALLAPPAEARRIFVYYDFHGVDDENIRRDEHKRVNNAVLSAELGPDRTTNRLIHHYAWGGELYVEYDLRFALLPANAVRVTIVGRMWEGRHERRGTNEPTSIADEEVTNVIVPVDGEQNFENELYASAARHGDRAKIAGVIRNEPNPT